MIISGEMPVIDLEALKKLLTDEEYEIVRGVVATRGKNKGRLRASKPKTGKIHRVEDDSTFIGRHWEYVDRDGVVSGKTAYVWRHIAFAVSPHRQHQSMPTMSFCDLPHVADREERKNMEHGLIDLADKVIKTVPAELHYGTMNWGRALGAF